MPKYNFECNVFGQWEGEVDAKNKKEALEKAKDELGYEGLYPDGEIYLERRPKNDQP